MDEEEELEALKKRKAELTKVVADLADIYKWFDENDHALLSAIRFDELTQAIACIDDVRDDIDVGIEVSLKCFNKSQ